MVKQKLIFLYLILFPLGQILRIPLNLPWGIITIHPLEVVVFLVVLAGFFERKNLPRPKLKQFGNFACVLIFSWFFSLTYFSFNQSLIGLLYLVRLVLYGLFLQTIFSEVKQKPDFYLNSLICVGFFMALFGWFQYFLFPDLRALKEFGWDDHLFRLVSTFLDPAFTGIILVFTLILAFFKYEQGRKPHFLWLIIFLLLSLAFAYSRASYLALFVAALLYSTFSKKWSVVFKTLLVILAFILFLPRPAGHGVLLERTHSLFLKIENYQTSWFLIKQSPLFGLGFNNLCVAKAKFWGEMDYQNHSCSGLDNSFLVVAATTGIVGLMIFLDLIVNLIKKTQGYLSGQVFLISGAGLLIHSFFSHSLFYPWVLGWMAFLLALSWRIKGRN